MIKEQSHVHMHQQNKIQSMAYKEFERGWKLVKKYEVHEIISANVFEWTTTFDPMRVASSL